MMGEPNESSVCVCVCVCMCVCVCVCVCNQFRADRVVHKLFTIE